ncbi:MAG TPA: acyl-CoA dehydrogenase, partial [Alcanivorax sp.]|nr:acyl-CoA dehydrogenase [Alcanivorax sp.]
MSDLEQFRAETRAWLEANCPEEMRQPLKSQADHCWGGRKWQFQSDAQKVWMERMADKGWTAPQWPKEYGGGGLTKAQAKIIDQEFAKAGAYNPIGGMGVMMFGPTLLEYGSEK